MRNTKINQLENEEQSVIIDKCITCGNPVAFNADVCPHCGEKLPSPNRRLAELKAEEDEKKAINKGCDGCLIATLIIGAILILIVLIFVRK